jgi:hypothetical protein
VKGSRTFVNRQSPEGNHLTKLLKNLVRGRLWSISDIVPRTYMVALRLAESSVLKFKLGRLRGHQVVFSRYAQKVISRFLRAAQFSHRATCYSPLTIDLAIRNIWGAVLHSLRQAPLTLKPPNR